MISTTLDELMVVLLLIQILKEIISLYKLLKE